MAYETPAQVNDSQVAHPVIVFQVNLITGGLYNTLQPNRSTIDGNEVTSEQDNLPATRGIYLPGLIGNVEGIGPSGFLRHGQQFTVKGAKATYLKNLYCPGTIYDVLTVVSQS